MLVMYIAIMKTTYIPVLWIVNVIQYEAKYLWRNYRRRSEFKHSLVTGRSTLSEGRVGNKDAGFYSIPYAAQ